MFSLGQWELLGLAPLIRMLWIFLKVFLSGSKVFQIHPGFFLSQGMDATAIQGILFPFSGDQYWRSKSDAGVAHEYW